MRIGAYTVGVCAVIGIMAGGVLAKRPTPARDRTMQVVQDLERTIPRVSFDEEPFVDVVAWLRTTAGLKNVLVQWRTLENTGYIDRETPVTLELRDLPLADVLDWILRDVSQDTPPDEQLRYAVERGVLTIAPRRTFDERLVVRVYNVEHLLQGRWFWADAPEIRVAQTGQGGGGGANAGGGGATAGTRGGTIITGGEGAAEFDFDGRRGDQLVRLIDVLETLRPATWATNGGEGTIRFMNGMLIITQTPEVHEMIGGLRTHQSRS